MFDLSWSHILIFLVVALVVVGPKDMPKLLRIIGQWVGKARAMANEFRKSFDDMARQSELDELRAEIENLRHERPLSELERDMQAPVMRPREAVAASPAVAAPEVSTEPPAAPKPLAHEPGDA